MRDESAFDDTQFLGLSRRSARDPYRLERLAEHLTPDEHPLVLMAVRGGTLVVTDRRVLEFRAHLEARGAWNVKEFLGYEVRREIDRAAVRDVQRHTDRSPPGAHAVEDAIRFVLEDRAEDVVVSRGPETTLEVQDFGALRAAVLGQAK